MLVRRNWLMSMYARVWMPRSCSVGKCSGHIIRVHHVSSPLTQKGVWRTGIIPWALHSLT